MRQAIERLTRAVELDPEFALAHAELADCYALLNWYVEPPPPGGLATREAVCRCGPSKLIRIWPKRMRRSVLSDFTTIATGKTLNANCEKRFVLKPGIQVAHRWYAYSLSAMGRHEEAFAEMERAREISPQSPVIATAVANVLFLAGRFDDAIEQCHKALELDSGAVAAHTVLRWAYEKKGMHHEALAAFEQERVLPATRRRRARNERTCWPRSDDEMKRAQSSKRSWRGGRNNG